MPSERLQVVTATKDSKMGTCNQGYVIVSRVLIINVLKQMEGNKRILQQVIK